MKLYPYLFVLSVNGVLNMLRPTFPMGQPQGELIFNTSHITENGDISQDHLTVTGSTHMPRTRSMPQLNRLTTNIYSPLPILTFLSFHEIIEGLRMKRLTDYCKIALLFIFIFYYVLDLPSLRVFVIVSFSFQKTVLDTF